MTTHFFVGANSGGGFQNLFPQMVHLDDTFDFMILKGGPGVGKNTFMRQIGQAMEAAGTAVEYLHCSGDPDSLDGVVLPQLRCAVADGTSPHEEVTKGRFSADPSMTGITFNGVTVHNATMYQARPQLCQHVRSSVGDICGRDLHLFENLIEYTIKIAECPAFDKSIFTHAPKSPAAKSCFSLAESAGGIRQTFRHVPKNQL